MIIRLNHSTQRSSLFEHTAKPKRLVPSIEWRTKSWHIGIQLDQLVRGCIQLWQRYNWWREIGNDECVKLLVRADLWWGECRAWSNVSVLVSNISDSEGQVLVTFIQICARDEW